MKKIIVIGCPGSGKSTFSRALHQATGIPLFHLDNLFWNADKTTVDKDVFYERIAEILQKNSWIIDGNYASTMEMRMEMCDTVIFLDFPPDICLAGIAERKGKKRSDMPWVETDDDSEFLEYVKNFNTNYRSQIMELLDRYCWKNIYRFSDRTEVQEFLKCYQER